MKTNKLYITVLLTVFLLSCSKSQDNNISIDFGTKEYEEPFVGLLKSQPSFLKVTLEWPVFRSLKSDTVSFVKLMEIEFNEDAIRSQSEATLLFTDSLGKNIPDYVHIFCNDTLLKDNKCTLIADSPSKKVLIKMVVHPKAGETTQIGLVQIMGQELDVVNEIPLNTDFSKIGDWKFTQEIGWPLLIWILWFLIALVLVVIICVFLYLIYKLLEVIVIGFTEFWGSIQFNRWKRKYHSNISHIESNDYSKNKNGKKQKKSKKSKKSKKIKCPLIALKNFIRKYRIYSLNRIISNTQNEISKRAKSAIKVTRLLNAIYEDVMHCMEQKGMSHEDAQQLAQDKYDEITNQLSHCTMNAVNKIDSAYSYVPSTLGYWLGSAGNSMLIVAQGQYEMIPPNGNSYNNPRQLKVWEILKMFGIKGIEYINYEPKFESLAKGKVVLKGTHFYRHESDIPKSKKDLLKIISVHERAFAQLAKQNGWTIEQARKYKEDNNLLWHECWDCATLLLIPREIHALFSHLGGIAIANALMDIPD